MDISNEKLAEIIAATKNIPQLNDAISELSRDTAVLRVNMENLTKEHEKHLEFGQDERAYVGVQTAYVFSGKC